MFDKDLIGSVGISIIGINCSNTDFVITRLSDLGENWEINSECPKCNRYLCFHKRNVNKLIRCKCGQKIKVEIPDYLL